MEIDDQVPAREWDRFVATHPAGHVLQTSAWGAHKSEFGWHAACVAVRERGTIVAGAQVLFRRLAQDALRLAIAYVPKGPLVDLADAHVCRLLFDALHRKSRSEKAILLKIEPDLPPSPVLTTQLAGYGFRPGQHTIQPRRTLVLDITSPVDDILGRMKSKTRYNIRLASRHAVQVRLGSEGDLDMLYKMYAETSLRDGFAIREPAYYFDVWGAFLRRGMAQVFIAEVKRMPAAGLILFHYGKAAYYMYGMSGASHREKMPNYLLQ